MLYMSKDWTLDYSVYLSLGTGLVSLPLYVMFLLEKLEKNLYKANRLTVLNRRFSQQ